MSNLMTKQDLTGQELQLLSTEMDKKKKSITVSWLMWFFLGGFGGHRYYLGKIGTGILMTLTLGGLGIWALIDAFLINKMVRKLNDEIEGKIIQEIKVLKNA